MTARPIVNKARRDDVIVVHTPSSYDVLGKGRTVVEGYRIGFVTSVTRDGRAKRVNTGRDEIAPDGRRTWLVANDRERVDVDGLRAWLVSDENTQPQPTLDVARDVVRRFLR